MAKSDPDRDVVAKGTGRGSSLPVIIVARPTTVIRISFSAGFLSSSPSLPPTVSSKRASGYGPRLQASLDDDLIVSAIELPSPSPLPPSLFLSKCTPRFAPFKVSTPFFSSRRSTRVNGMIFIKKFLGGGGRRRGEYEVEFEVDSFGLDFFWIFRLKFLCV